MPDGTMTENEMLQLIDKQKVSMSVMGKILRINSKNMTLRDVEWLVDMLDDCGLGRDFSFTMKEYGNKTEGRISYTDPDNNLQYVRIY